MKRALVLVALGACGRIGFDPSGRDGGDATTDAEVPFVETVGELDPTFGTNGQTIVMRGLEDAQMFDVRPRAGGYFSFGRVLDPASSRGQLLAWTSGGQLDPSFSTDGVADYRIEDGDWGYGMVPLADGRWLLLGDGFRSAQGFDDVLFTLIDETGQLDPGFAGGAGQRYLDVNDDDTVYRGVETPRGVVACGVSERGDPDTHHVLVGLRLDGNLDAGFGVNGVVIDDSTGPTDICYDAIADGNGMIVTTGTSGANPIVTRYDALGARDTTFASGGRHGAATSSGEGFAVAIAPDGDIVFVGSELDGAFVGRLSPAGVPRTTFGTNGMAMLRLGLTAAASRALFYDVVVQPNGKIVAVGYREVSATEIDGVVVRLLADGSLDPSFGTNGMIVLDAGADDTLNAVYAESGGLIAVGSTTIGSLDRAWIVRLR